MVFGPRYRLGHVINEHDQIHPLMPFPLFITAEFLYENLSSQESYASCLQDLIDVLGKLKNVNNQEQTYLDLLPQSCLSKSIDMLNHAAKTSSAP